MATSMAVPAIQEERDNALDWVKWLALVAMVLDHTWLGSCRDKGKLGHFRCNKRIFQDFLYFEITAPEGSYVIERASGLVQPEDLLFTPNSKPTALSSKSPASSVYPCTVPSCRQPLWRLISRKNEVVDSLLPILVLHQVLPFLQYQDKRGAIHRSFDAVQRGTYGFIVQDRDGSLSGSARGGSA